MNKGAVPPTSVGVLCERLPVKYAWMKAVAIKKGQTKELAPALKEMGTLRCDGCGEEFIVFHDTAFRGHERR